MKTWLPTWIHDWQTKDMNCKLNTWLKKCRWSRTKTLTRWSRTKTLTQADCLKWRVHIFVSWFHRYYQTYCEIIALWSVSLFSLYSLDFSFGSYSWLWCVFPCFVQLQRNMEIRSKCWRTTIQKIDFQKGSVVIRCLPPNVYIIFSDDIYLARFCTVLELLHKILSPVCIRTTAYIRLLQIRNLALGLSKK